MFSGVKLQRSSFTDPESDDVIFGDIGMNQDGRKKGHGLGKSRQKNVTAVLFAANARLRSIFRLSLPHSQHLYSVLCATIVFSPQSPIFAPTARVPKAPSPLRLRQSTCGPQNFLRDYGLETQRHPNRSLARAQVQGLSISSN